MSLDGALIRADQVRDLRIEPHGNATDWVLRCSAGSVSGMTTVFAWRAGRLGKSSTTEATVAEASGLYTLRRQADVLIVRVKDSAEMVYEDGPPIAFIFEHRASPSTR